MGPLFYFTFFPNPSPPSILGAKSLEIRKNQHFFPLATRSLPMLIRPKFRGMCKVLNQKPPEPANTTQATHSTNSTTTPIHRANPVVSSDLRVSEAPKKRIERQMRAHTERSTYLFAAVASSTGIMFLAAAAVYYRFVWQMQGEEVSITEMFGTFSLALGASVGMEFWARWAHRTFWHASLWSMHESHHRPRDGPFELNDVFAIINAVPAIGLMAYGFFHQGLVPGLCFGAGLGITLFGMAYMFVHDGLVHRRFPVGPIANVPYLERVAAAHQLHHADKFNGVPYGLFLGPKELEGVGGLKELEKLVQQRKSGFSEKGDTL